MSNMKEIKNRIKSVRDTQKITNAMYLISSTKMRKAKKEHDGTKPYFEMVAHEIKRIFRTDSKIQSRYFFPENNKEDLQGTYAYLVISADKGLAGAYNHNVMKEALKVISKHEDRKVFVVGEVGRRFLTAHKIDIEQSFLYTAQNPTLSRAREITDILLDLYDNGDVSKLYVVYTDFKSSFSEEATAIRLLPFHKADLLKELPPWEKEVKTPFEFMPSAEDVLDNSIRSYVLGIIYGALVESYCSEQNARMNAMDSANKNAEGLLGDLSIQYNHTRQSIITQEITEVSAGAKAMRKKRMQKAAKMKEVQG